MASGTGDRTRKNRRSKSWGYEVEKAAERDLSLLFPDLKRSGSSVQVVKGAPDLAQELDFFMDQPVAARVVYIRDKENRQTIVAMDIESWRHLVLEHFDDTCPDRVYVQAKGRARTWIGGLLRELKRAVR